MLASEFVCDCGTIALYSSSSDTGSSCVRRCLARVFVCASLLVSRFLWSCESAATHPTQLNAGYMACMTNNCGDPNQITWPRDWGVNAATKQNQLDFVKGNEKATNFMACSCNKCGNYDAIKKSYLYPEACTQSNAGSGNSGSSFFSGNSGSSSGNSGSSSGNSGSSSGKSGSSYYSYQNPDATGTPKTGDQSNNVKQQANAPATGVIAIAIAVPVAVIILAVVVSLVAFWWSRKSKDPNRQPPKYAPSTTVTVSGTASPFCGGQEVWVV